MRGVSMNWRILEGSSSDNLKYTVCLLWVRYIWNGQRCTNFKIGSDIEADREMLNFTDIAYKIFCIFFYLPSLSFLSICYR